MSKKSKKAARKPASPSTDSAVQVMDPKDFQAAPRKRRSSKCDPVAQKLLEAGKGKLVPMPVPKDSNPQQYRSYVYIALQKSLKHFAPKATHKISIQISADQKTLGVSLK